jgi:protein TonB
MSPPREAETSSEILPLALAVAVGLHVALAIFTPKNAPAARHVAPSMEIDLVPPPAPTHEPEPLPSPSPTDVAPSTPKMAPSPTAAPARAGHLLTAEPTAVTPPSAEPLDFVTDPRGADYGFGVVARGGTAIGAGVAAPVSSALPSATASAPASIGKGLVPASDLSERPRLAADDPCSGYYPPDATVDVASVLVRVVVESSGKTRSVQLLEESPSGQGFGQAARTCLTRQHWSAARDKDGNAVPTASSVRVRFQR